jgi:UDP-glucose 4-epimerase
MKKALVTGASGFFGDILKRRLLAEGWRCVNVDLEKDPHEDAALLSIQGDVRDRGVMDRAFREGPFDVVYHCAALLAHGGVKPSLLWDSNVYGTRSVAEHAKAHRVPRVVFTSSNCLWGRPFNRPVVEEDPPEPCETYGKSKWESEKILAEYRDSFHAITIRCPTIMDEGRLGLLSILFEFIDEGRKVWVVGGGANRYQFIYAQDLAAACILAADYGQSAVFNIGSDNVKTFREVYGYVIEKAGTGARVAALPRLPTVAAMRIAHWLRLSPLGPYQYRMIAESFVFDTSKIKAALGWKPTLTNEEMLYRAYRYYHENRREIESRKNVSAHRQAARMGIIALLKMIS